MGYSLFEPMSLASGITDRVLVSLSGGKDSAVVLDLCCRHFEHVEAFFMYLVPGLSFQERLLRHYERRYGIVIHRIPHFMVSEFFRYGSFRKADFSVPIVSVAETYSYMRERTGIWWIAGGERIADSLWRRAMLKSSGGSVNRRRGRFYPVAYWRLKNVQDYIAYRRLAVALESRVLGHSFRDIGGPEITAIKRVYPEDYERIKRWYPFVTASLAKGASDGEGEGAARAR